MSAARDQVSRSQVVQSGLSTLCVVLASIAVMVAVPAAWVALNVTSESGFVALSDAVSTDQDVRTALSEVLVEELLDGVELPEAIRGQANDLVRETVDETLDDDGFRAAWQDTLRLSHRGTFDGDAPDGVLRLELAPFAQLVADRADTLSSPPDTLPVELDGGPSRETVETIDSSRVIAFVAAVAVILLTVGALLLAPRRSRAVAGLGLGLVVAASVVWLGVRLVLLPTADAGTDARADLARAFIEVATRSLDAWLVVAGVVGVVALVLGWTVSALTSSRERRRRPPGPSRTAWPMGS